MEKRSGGSYLIAINPAGHVPEFAITEGAAIAGGDPANDLVLSDPTVSRRHATISCRDGRCEIADLGSMNGTFVNDRRVAGSMPVNAGDEIRFGQARFVLWTARARDKPLAGGGGTLLAAAAMALAIGLLAGFIGGGVAATRVHGSVLARQFVLVDQNGKPLGFMAVFPKQGQPNCRDCDGKAHLVVLGAEGQLPQVWPPTGPTINPAQLLELIKALRFAGL